MIPPEIVILADELRALRKQANEIERAFWSFALYAIDEEDIEFLMQEINPKSSDVLERLN